MTYLFSAIALIAAVPGTAGADAYAVRFLGGYGMTSTDAAAPGMQKANDHYAVQVLQYIGGDARGRGWGVELAKHRVFRSAAGSSDYTELGLMVEAVMFGLVTAQLGTAGYFAVDSNRHPVGLRASLGFDQKVGKQVFLSCFYRDDIIYDLQRVTAWSIELGAGFRF